MGKATMKDAVEGTGEYAENTMRFEALKGC
jgi:hypothetical protein